MDENMQIKSEPSSDEETCNDNHYSKKLLYIDDIKAERSDNEQTNDKNNLENVRLYGPTAKKMRLENKKGHRVGATERNYSNKRNSQSSKRQSLNRTPELRYSKQDMCTCIPSPDQSIQYTKSSNKSQSNKCKRKKGEDETQINTSISIKFEPSDDFLYEEVHEECCSHENEELQHMNIEDLPFLVQDEDELDCTCNESDATPHTQTRKPNANTTAYIKSTATTSIATATISIIAAATTSTIAAATTSTIAAATTSTIAAATMNNAVTINGTRYPAGNDGELVQKYGTDSDFSEELRVEVRDLLASYQKLSQKPPAAKRKAGKFISGEEEPLNDQDFLWRPMITWIGKKHVYQKRNASGPVRKYDNAYDAFRAIWDDKILYHIVATTNLYAATIKKDSLKEDWYDTNIDEILILLCFWMMLGVVRMPSIKSCFCEIPILQTGVFRNLLTENRYWNLNRAFCMTSKAPTSNLLHRMGPVLDHLNTKFQGLYMLQQDIKIDESSTTWQVPADSMSQFDAKGGRLCINIYHLRDCASGYLWSFSMYAGRSTHDVGMVSKLLKPRLNLGHVLYMKDLYNWPSLARFLNRNGTNLVGTVNQSAYLPLPIRSGTLTHGEMVARHAGDVMVVAIQEYETRRTFISTYHDLTQAGNERGARRIRLVRDYESKMSVVDPFDHPLEPYLSEKKESKKWSRELFKQFLNFSIQNARVLAGKSSVTELNTFASRLSLVQQIVDRHHSKIPSRKLDADVIPVFPVTRLTERHFVRRIPAVVITKIQIVPVKRNCVWCAKNGQASQTEYECPQCALPLCLENCFEQFHTTP